MATRSSKSTITTRFRITVLLPFCYRFSTEITEILPSLPNESRFSRARFFIPTFAPDFGQLTIPESYAIMNFNPKTWQPVAIDAFGLLNVNGAPAKSVPEAVYLRIYTTDGGIIDAKRCPTDKPLYCSRDGQFFSLTAGGSCLREVKPIYNPGMQNHKGGSTYPVMRHFGNKLCHHLMYETWIGARTKGMEIDHINGNMMDWSLSNLEEVTPAENRKRAKILRAMREAGNDPKQYSPARLKAIFAQFSLMDGDTQMIREMTKHQEL